MSSLSENLKDGLKYPLYAPKKIITVTIMYCIMALLSIGAVYVLVSALRKSFYLFGGFLKYVDFISGSFVINNATMSTVNNASTVALNNASVAVNNSSIVALNNTSISALNNSSIAALNNSIPINAKAFSAFMLVPSIESIILLIGAVIISIFVTGYLYKIVSSTINGKNTVPKFNGFINLFVNGIKLVVIGFVYSLIPIIISRIGCAFVGKGNSAIGTVGLIIILVSCILAIVLWIMQTMAINNMAANDDKIRYAFDFKTIRGLIESIGWLKFFGLMILLVLANGIILSSLAIFGSLVVLLFTIGGHIGIIIGSILMGLLMILGLSYLTMVNSRFCALLYRECIK